MLEIKKRVHEEGSGSDHWRPDKDITEKRKDWKSRSEEKIMAFCLAFLFPAGKQEAVNQDENIEDRRPGVEVNLGSRYRQRLGRQGRPWAHSIYIHVKQE